VRFAKSEIIAEFDRQDRSYRLAIISTHWLQGGTQYKPSAAEEAKGLRMKVANRWISFSDLSDILETDAPRLAITSDFILNQLHALIRAPFELLSDYCEDADEQEPARQLLTSLKETAWYPFARVIRNAISHNFYFHFGEGDKRQMPITWNGIMLTEDLTDNRSHISSFGINRVTSFSLKCGCLPRHCRNFSDLPARPFLRRLWLRISNSATDCGVYPNHELA
jgi:hypothetical protein